MTLRTFSTWCWSIDRWTRGNIIVFSPLLL